MLRSLVLIGSWLLALVTATPIHAQTAETGAVDLIVFAGQSNMGGNVSTIAAEAAGPSLIPEPYKTLYAAPVSWAQQWNSNPLPPSLALPLNPADYGNAFANYHAGFSPFNGKAIKWGPEVAFLRSRYLATNRTVYFVKFTVGGTALFYSPTLRNWNVQAQGAASLLQALEGRIRAASNALLARGFTRVNIRLLWCQGESDTGARGDVYADNLVQLGTYLRGKFGTGQSTFRVDSVTLIALKGTQSAQAGQNVAATRLVAQMVNVHDYPASLIISDGIHLGPAGQIRHGTEMELNSRTRPRRIAQSTTQSLLSVTVPRPTAAGTVLFAPTGVLLDGSEGWDYAGQTSGLGFDNKKGTLYVKDPALVTPGARGMQLRRHTATGMTYQPFVLTILP